MKNIIIVLSLICLGFVLVACSDDGRNADNNSNQTDIETEQENDETVPAAADVEDIVSNAKVDTDTAVAVVNGEEIKGNIFNLMLSQTVTNLQNYGQDASDESVVKEETLNAVISQTILMQEIDNKGIEASSDELSELIEQFKTNFDSEEKYEEYLAGLDLSSEEFSKQVALEIEVQKYKETELSDPEVTDEQIEQFYAQYEEVLSAQDQEVPELSEMEEAIRQEIVKQKKNTQLNERVQQLTEEAEIERLI